MGAGVTLSLQDGDQDFSLCLKLFNLYLLSLSREKAKLYGK